MSDPSTQRYAVASIDGSELSTASLRTGLALVTRAGASERGQRTSFGRLRLGTSLEEPPQARLVKIAHGRLAAWLDPFGMLPSQVLVNLSLKLGHGVGRVTD